jgi:hypothetical protein
MQIRAKNANGEEDEKKRELRPTHFVGIENKVPLSFSLSCMPRLIRVRLLIEKCIAQM